jgi:hypothetical protein
MTGAEALVEAIGMKIESPGITVRSLQEVHQPEEFIKHRA